MECIVAKTAGFCYGVKRALRLTEEAAGEEKIYTYGPLIHNAEVVRELREKNVDVWEEEIGDALRGRTVIVRSHGVSEETYQSLEKAGATVIDATCPFVKRIHERASKEEEEGRTIVIIGSKTHPEVIGIRGWCKNEVIILENKGDIDLLKGFENKPITIVAQTTFDQNNFQELVEIVNNTCYDTRVYNTICSATKERQDEARELASKVDLMLVIGDRNSSNTQKLFEICKKACADTYHIQTSKDVDDAWFFNVDKVGITAGASTPNTIIEEVQINVRTKF